jgi:hypothetical protein
VRINSLQYIDNTIDWWLSETAFSDLTLLVGVSGVGKTMILDTIWRLKEIANGKSYSGVSWEVSFTVRDGRAYKWSGRYAELSKPRRTGWHSNAATDKQGEESDLGSEELTLVGQDGAQDKIIERGPWGTTLSGNPTPRVPSSESALRFFREEETVKPASEAFRQVIRSEPFLDPKRDDGMSAYEFDLLWKDGVSFEDLMRPELRTMEKAALAYRHHPAKFNEIKKRFFDVFDQVEDLAFDVPPTAAASTYEYPVLKIRERGVKNWIWHGDISSGMLKTFIHISEMFLWPKGTVVLIDEFENSLGINCIETLTEQIQEDRGLQFIVTSHHPYIINNISPRHWKLVTRKANAVSARDVTDLRINPSSRQKAFLQLINLEEYREGIRPA